MSVRVMSAVFDRYPKGGGEMLLALSLADHAHDDGTHIYPSVVSLAQKTRQSVRAVQYQLKAMLGCGWLVLTNEGDGRYGQHREYSISSAWLQGAEIAPTSAKKRKNRSPEGAEIAPSDNPENMSPIAPMGANYDKGGCNPLHPSYNRKEPSVNHQSALRRNSRASRLTEAWVLPRKFGQWALEKYPDWTPEFIRERGIKFRDHWSPIPGKAGLKTDWFATWRNFCLGEAEFIARTTRTSAGGVAWWTSDPLILSEGVKRGIKPLPGESMFAFKGRVQEAIEVAGKSSTEAGKPVTSTEDTGTPAPAAIAVPWWSSDSLVLAEGSKRGLQPFAGEAMIAFKGRVQATIEAAGKAIALAASAPDTTENQTASPEAVVARRMEIKRALHAAQRGSFMAGKRG